MGGFISRIFRKADRPYGEVLKQLDEDIRETESIYKEAQLKEKSLQSKLAIYFIPLYLTAAFIYYLYFMPRSWQDKLLFALPFIVSPPLLFYMTRRLVHYLFQRRVILAQNKLKTLRDQKKKKIEDFKKETDYENIQRILEMYDEETKKRLHAQALAQAQAQAQQQQLAQRNAQGSQPRGPQGPVQNAPPQKPTGPTPVRPILPSERGAFDKVVDYLVGEGPNSRFALICTHCHHHNGMALQEEFDYIEYYCAYCSKLNPARKSKPVVGVLPLHLQARNPANAPQSYGSSAQQRPGSGLQQPSVQPGAHGMPVPEAFKAHILAKEREAALAASSASEAQSAEAAAAAASLASQEDQSTGSSSSNNTTTDTASTETVEQEQSAAPSSRSRSQSPSRSPSRLRKRTNES